MVRKFALLLLLLGTTSVLWAENIRVKGSAELLPVVDRWAMNYGKQHPGTNIQSLGGGTTVGINSLVEGTADVATSERSLTDTEAKAVRGTAVDIVVATDAVVFILHPSNPVKSVTMQQLEDIYSGKITNWMELGGPNLPIHPLAIGSNFGMTQLVKDRVLQGKPFGGNIRMASSEHDLLSSVWIDPSAIAYSGMALGHEFRHLAIAKEKGGPAFNASTENILNGKYTLVHSVHLYMNAKASAAVKDFIDWTLTHEGQQMVSAAGIWPLSQSDREKYKAKVQ